MMKILQSLMREYICICIYVYYSSQLPLDTRHSTNIESNNQEHYTDRAYHKDTYR